MKEVTLQSYNNPCYARRFLLRVRGLRISAERTFVKRIQSSSGFLNTPILDAGCGIGRDIAMFLRAGLNMRGVDGSGELLSLAHQELGLSRERLFQSDLRVLPFCANVFGGIWSRAVLGHFSYPYNKQVLEEFARVSISDALVFIRVREGEKEVIEERDGFQRFRKYYTSQEIKELMTVSGFERIRIISTKDEGGFAYRWLNVWSRRRVFGIGIK